MTSPNVTLKPPAYLHYGRDGIDRLYARVWGDSIHFGYYRDGTESLEGAVVETKRRLAAAAGIKAGTAVLEVASGWGASARFLARSFGAVVTATNYEPSQRATAEVLTDVAGLGGLIRHAEADFHALPFEDESFDVWWCQEATVHAADKHKVFAEAYRVLKPGGRIVFSDQTTRRSRCDVTALARLAERHGSDDLWDVGDFTAALEGAGFAQVTASDWRMHMARHFANLVFRIEETMPCLLVDLAEDTVLHNRDLWRFGRDLALSGGIGWSCFGGVK